MRSNLQNATPRYIDKGKKEEQNYERENMKKLNMRKTQTPLPKKQARKAQRCDSYLQI